MRRGVYAALPAALLALSICTVATVAQETDAEPATPAGLQPLERLVGGRWHLGDDAFQTFTWGVGRRSVRAENYFVLPDGPKLVGEMTFLYHPGKAALVGTGVAVDMGIDVFEYTSIELRGDTLVFFLETYGPQASDQTQRETWTFTDPDHFEWTLWAPGEDGAWIRRFGGTYERRD